MRVRRRPGKITHEEIVYRDVFTLVRMYQMSWLGGLIIFGIIHLFELLLWWFDPELQSGPGLDEVWSQVAARLFALAFTTTAALVTGIVVCRMSRWFGVLVLLYCVSMVALCALICVVVILRGAATLIWGDESVGLAFLTTVFMLAVLFGYFFLLGVRAGRRFVFEGAETRRAVSEIDTLSRGGWFSKMMGMPLPFGRIRKNRVVSTALFVVSSVAFASFALLALCVPLLATFPVLFYETVRAGGEGSPGGAEGAARAFSMPTALALWCGPLIFTGLAAALALAVGRTTRAAARRLTITSILDSQRSDGRPPILFLRAFRDDQVTLARPRLPLPGRLVNLLQSKGSLDVLLLEEGTAFGPVVAVGNPGDPIPPYGAARGYFSDGDWRRSVSRLADDSSRIVICLDATDGVLWELEHLAAGGHASKTLFLLNPDVADAEANNALRQKVVSRISAAARVPLELSGLSESAEPVIGFFFDDGGRAQVAVSSEFSEASYMLVTRWFLRTKS